LTLILDILGVDTEAMPSMHKWIRMIVEALGDPVAMQQVNAELEACHSYLLSLIERKRQTPANDLISSLIQAEAEGDRLSESELVAMIFLLIMAGYQTTGTMISNGMLALLMYPKQMALLQSNPALVKTAVEEFLRYRSPLMLATMRWARADVELGGKLIHRGDQVVISVAAANHDEKIFTDADGLDITRAENHHLAFGKGIHYCLGAPLARLEGQIAINTLLRRLPNLRLQVDPTRLMWRPGSMVLGLMQLPVTF
jgi:cytochrome P450